MKCAGSIYGCYLCDTLIMWPIGPRSIVPPLRVPVLHAVDAIAGVTMLHRGDGLVSMHYHLGCWRWEGVCEKCHGRYARGELPTMDDPAISRLRTSELLMLESSGIISHREHMSYNTLADLPF